MSTTVAPYGSWKSPIQAEDTAQASVRLAEPWLDGESVYWSERRPKEGGRCVVMELGPAGVVERTPAPYNVRTRVHEYGGGAFCVAGGVVFFSDFASGRVHRQVRGQAPVAITPELKGTAYADYRFDQSRDRLIAVREQSSNGEEPVAAIVAIDPSAQKETILGETISGEPISGEHRAVEPRVLVKGADFFSNPRISPDGKRLCWLRWNHPNMPWDGTELWVADLDPAGVPENPKQIAGNVDESVFQPEWADEDQLVFVSDRSGWWNLQQAEGLRGEPSIVPLAPKEAEFARPQWVFGMRTYALAGAGRMVCSYTQQGTWRLLRLETAGTTSSLIEIEQPFTDIDGVQANAERAVFVGTAPDQPSALVELDLETLESKVLRTSSRASDPGYLSVGEPIRFDSDHGGTAHAFYYPPKNREFEGPEGTLPPLIVESHGGPTAACDNGYDSRVQFWTSRGFAVVDVNYGGSTGFGRRYRERLDGAWGIVDVDDCAAAARFLADQGLVDAQRLAIRGGSAGGYTTLAALAFRDEFRAGASHYGVGDLEALARETHKFESRYLDRLVGPYPESRNLYLERSPIHSADRLACPVIFFQGLDDKVVPPNQAEAMVAALRKKKVPVAYVSFEGEGHGFRQAENIVRALEAELYFYSRIFGFEPADDLEPIDGI